MHKKIILISLFFAPISTGLFAFEGRVFSVEGDTVTIVGPGAALLKRGQKFGVYSEEGKTGEIEIFQTSHTQAKARILSGTVERWSAVREIPEVDEEKESAEDENQKSKDKNVVPAERELYAESTTTWYSRGLRSLAFPGWGQMYAGRKTRGMIYSGATFLLPLAGLVEADQKKSRLDKKTNTTESAAKQQRDFTIFTYMIGAYPGYGLSVQIASMFTTYPGSPVFQQYERARKLKEQSLQALAVFWIWNAIDAAWLAGRTTKGPVTFRPVLKLGASSFAPGSSKKYAINELKFENRLDLSMSVKF